MAMPLRRWNGPVQHLLPTFLDDPQVYRQAVTYWRDLWAHLAPRTHARGWITPWLTTGHPTICDGNPIFSAWAPAHRKGLRVIQYAPTSEALECASWFDTVGGDATDPQRIHELVITCALSDGAAQKARQIIEAWL